MTYEAGIRPNPRDGGYRFDGRAANARPSQIFQPIDVIGRAYEPPAMATGGSAGRLLPVLGALLQLVLPVALLMALGAAALLYGDRSVTWLGAETGQWLTMGHLIVPLTFFAIQLTNRRYGASYAMAQTVLAWGLAAAALWAASADLTALTGRPVPPLNEILAFGAALFFGHLFSVFVFDRTRGPRWWWAPLQSTFWGGTVFCLIAFPAAYSGTSIAWPDQMWTYIAIMAASSLLLLVPYWTLRGVVPPRSGFGGY